MACQKLAIGERHNGPIEDENGDLITQAAMIFENAWAAACRDEGEPDDDHGHMVLFDFEFAPNVLGGLLIQGQLWSRPDVVALI